MISSLILCIVMVSLGNMPMFMKHVGQDAHVFLNVERNGAFMSYGPKEFDILVNNKNKQLA
jgi:hypothetical protein